MDEQMLVEFSTLVKKVHSARAALLKDKYGNFAGATPAKRVAAIKKHVMTTPSRTEQDELGESIAEQVKKHYKDMGGN